MIFSQSEAARDNDFPVGLEGELGASSVAPVPTAVRTYPLPLPGRVEPARRQEALDGAWT